jgi:hypothetical protein
MNHFFRVLFALLKVWQWREIEPWDKADAEQLGVHLRRSGGTCALRNASITISGKAVQNGGPNGADKPPAGSRCCLSHALSVAWEPESQETSEDGEPEGADAFLERMRP